MEKGPPSRSPNKIKKPLKILKTLSFTRTQTMGTPEHNREPCPDRITDDMGGALGMGIVGGSVYHFMRGIRNSPRGERVRGGMVGARMNALRVGGSFAVWGGLFSAFDCTLVFLRQKEDPWNSIASGAAAGAILQMRQGLRAAARGGASGAVLLGLIEGALIVINKSVEPQQQELDKVMMEQQLQQHQQQLTNNVGPATQGGGEVPGASASPSSWFGRWFGGGDKKGSGGGLKTEVLESFDSPVPPTFEYMNNSS